MEYLHLDFMHSLTRMFKKKAKNQEECAFPPSLTFNRCHWNVKSKCENMKGYSLIPVS